MSGTGKQIDGMYEKLIVTYGQLLSCGVVVVCWPLGSRSTAEAGTQAPIF